VSAFDGNAGLHALPLDEGFAFVHEAFPLRDMSNPGSRDVDGCSTLEICGQMIEQMHYVPSSQYSASEDVTCPRLLLVSRSV
jgi:hypothetical protein